jgi:signal transduction histidine kinase/CheY-like chemotaxis protein
MEDYAEILNEDGVAKLQTVVRLTQRMEDLINSLLYFSRLGRAELIRQTVNLDELVQQVIATLTISRPQNEVESRIPQPLPSFECDRTQVRDEQGRIVDFRTEYVNDAACFNNQTTPDRQIGQGLFELLPGHPVSGLFEECSQVLETGQAIVKESLIYEDEYAQKHLVKAFDIQIAKLGDGFVATWRDITDRKQAEIERARLLEQAQSARAEAERVNRIKDEFLAVLSHELRSPLNPILGWTQLLQTRRLDPTKTASALAIIERNVRLQTQLIDDLLDVAKILRGKLSMDTTPVNLRLVIESAIDTVTTAAVAKSIRLHSVLSNIGQICGDSTRLQQIVWNLLSNAIKFTPKGGLVEIRLERVNDQALMIVSDTGKGIDSDFLPHIFESFRQEDVSITRNYGGLGLGLTIVRTLVEAHGGTIFAESQGEGLGATFTVCLPLLDTEPQKSQPDQLPESELDLTGIRVLAVDDQPDTREFFAELLTQYGAEVLSMASGAEVLVSLELFQPDVLVSDIGMPEMDGYTLLQQIRSLPASKGGKVPAIALTAYARVEDRELALICGFQDHISKPLDLQRLVQAVSDLARSSKKNSSRKFDTLRAEAAEILDS